MVFCRSVVLVREVVWGSGAFPRERVRVSGCGSG
jgi:hypothetical protein